MNFIKEKCAGFDRLLHKKPIRFLFVMIISVALTAALTGAAISKYAVVIYDDAKETIVFTSLHSPKDILAEEGILLSPHDEIEFSGFTDNKATIDILRAREIIVHADGTERKIQMTKGTVSDALAAMKITVSPEDLINVSLSEPIAADMDITINRVVNQNVTVEEPIPYETEIIRTSTMKTDAVRVIKEGVMGLKTTVKAQTLIDGVVVDEEILSTEIVEPKGAREFMGDPSAPATQLIPASEIELDGNGNPVNFTAKYTGKATAYSSLGRRTSLVPGCVAMNLSQFPKGTRVYIKTPNGSYTYGYSVVKDTGTALNEGTILVDLFFATYSQSVAFGAKNVDIYVLP